MHVYRCRAYPLHHYIARKEKLDSQAHIGYLVGYDFTNIYKIWILSQSKVIRTWDVRLKDDLLYNLSKLDLGAILKEQAEQLIETFDLPEMQVTELADDECDLLDTLIVNVPAAPKP